MNSNKSTASAPVLSLETRSLTLTHCLHQEPYTVTSFM